MAFDLTETLRELAIQVQDAGVHYAPGLAPWQAELQSAADKVDAEQQTQCLALLQALQSFILADEDPQSAYTVLVDLIAEVRASLGDETPLEGSGDSDKPTENTSELSALLNEFADQVEAVGPAFAPGLAPWQETWQEALNSAQDKTQQLCSNVLDLLKSFILADENHESFHDNLIDAICDLRQHIDGVEQDNSPVEVIELASSAIAEPSNVEAPPQQVDTASTPCAAPDSVVPRALDEPSTAGAKATPSSEDTPSPQVVEAPPVDTSLINLAAPEIMLEFATEGTEQLSECSEHLLLLDKNPDDKESLAAVFRCFHTIKGVAGFMGMDQLQSIAHAAEDLLDLARAGKLPLAGGPLDAIFDASDILAGLISQIPPSLNQNPWKPPESPKGPGLVARIRTLLEADPTNDQPVHELPLALIDPNAPAAASAATSASAASTRSKSSQQDSIRVDAERLDHLVDMIGELVINESMLIRAMEIGDERETQRQLVRMGKVTREVQSVGGSLRMIPVRGCFSKMARLARDVAKKSKKKVNFSLVGEDTELDKTVVDRIADPLVHLVRNAIDHGLEATADERTAAGKSAIGNVQLRAFHKGGNIHIEIEDDGRGMNRDRILEVAIERGVVRDGDGMSDRDVFRLVCEAGFSTKKQVTSLSGRGVGMDVVKRQIDKMGGTLDIQSSHGTGSCFSMRVPLTLAVIDGMVIGLGNGRFVIPTLNIVRLVEPDEAHISTIFEQGEMLIVAGEPIPVLRLEHLFNLGDSTAERRLAVVAEADGMRVALLIDELLGQQQAVIKNLGQGLGNVAGVSGCAIMPDGRVGLVLDVSGLLDLAKQPSNSTETPTMTQQPQQDAPATEEQWMS